MENEKLRKIYDAFAASGSFVSATPVEGQDAYHVVANAEAEYILQRFRPGLSARVPDMIRNKEMVYGHVRNRLLRQNVRDITRKHVTCFHTYRQQPYYKDHEGNYWTLTLFIKETHVSEHVSSPAVAREIGVGLGTFVQRTRDFDPRLLKESMPGYQNVSRWQQRLQESLETTSDDRKNAAATPVEQLRPFDEKARAWQETLEEEMLPARVTHNTFSAGSVLLDRNDRSLCVINLETVMPGILHYDFGDGARSACAPSGQFDAGFFREFASGFMQQAGRLLARKERETLHLACELMPYLQTIRKLVAFLREGATRDLLEAMKHLSFLLSAARERRSTKEYITACP
ncbi:MAG: aminoglycoside phosphotransferase family protein [Odoribacteraceae bacterium]|jgi:hypothetical protein|nr:aminoglycoside phosphotransferase family protein [Odoribacteraceae bacterium]